jgi:tryptophan synthase alpha chain
MDRIAEAFARARARQRAAFVAYLCAGDPDFATSLAACRAVLASGVDLLELGVPFSDPLADGLTNQLAAQRALAAGMTSARVFDLVRALRTGHPETPIIFYTYYNVVFAYGVGAYVRAAKAAGVDGMLTLDLPPEEAGDLLAASRAHDLKTVFIVAPTTADGRLPKITAAASGFVYYVSREGVTGVRDEMAGGIPEAVARIKAHTTLPVVVGFGLSRRDQINQVARWADGVVVGSALVNCIQENLGDTGRIVARLSAVTADLAAGAARS